jgi:hypothetical protein
MMAATMASQTLDFGFKPRAAPAPAEELVALWQRARIAAETAPACPCHGIVSGRIDADAMEGNMLAPLRSRYRDGGRGGDDDGGNADLCALIEKRLKKSPFAGLRQPFEQWLRALPGAPLAPAARQALIEDLRAALTYYAEAPPQFMCA